MIFHNPTAAEHRTQIQETVYLTPAGGEIDIPDHLAYVVEGRSMPLRRGRNPSPPDGGAPRGTTHEAMPAEVERLFGSPYGKPHHKAGFAREWARASRPRRAEMLVQLARMAEGRAMNDAAGDDAAVGPADPEPGAAEQAGDVAEVGGQLAEVAAAAGRRPRKVN